MPTYRATPADAAQRPWPDPELAALATKFTEALAAYAVAERHRNVCEERFLEDRPIPPAVLTGRSLGKLSRRLYWSEEDLEELLDSHARKKYWPVARAALPVARAYEAEVDRFAHACGFRAAEAAQEAALDALADLTEAILAAPAHSVFGLAVKAHVVKQWGRPEWWSDDPDDADAVERLAAQVLDAVIRTGGLDGEL